MQKRTAAITLAILGALSASGCAPQSPPVPTTYANVNECTSDGNDAATCKKAFEEAYAQTEKNGPKFASADACAAQFNNCQQSSGGWFMPAVMGYMVGNMMSSGSRAPATPVYIDRDNHRQAASFAGGTYRATPAAETYSARSSRMAASRASTSSRGGFGGRASGSYGG